MDRRELAALFRLSRILRDWHWFQFHFNHELNGAGHPLAAGIIDCALEVEARMPGYAARFVDRIASIGGRERHLPDWEQLLTVLAELHVVAQISRWEWPEGAIFVEEPTVAGSDRNPELSVLVDGHTYAYEVKAPAIFAHTEARGSNPTQVSSRYARREVLERLVDEGGVTWPRDNPVKDFLISAESKFRPFADALQNFTGILVICWDDFIYEPISALEHPACGLLTKASFYRDAEDQAVEFPSVGGVVVIRHLLQLILACQDQPLGDGLRSPFDYGSEGAFPWKTFHQNPRARLVPPLALLPLDARPPSPEMGAEYAPKELIWWLGNE